MFIERCHFAVDDAVGKLGRSSGDLRKFVSPVEAFARAQFAFATRDAHLNAIPVELHFVRPGVADGRAVQELAQLRFDEFGKLRLRLGARGFSGRHGFHSGLIGLGAVRLPCRIGRGLARKHERLWRGALAGSDLRHVALRGDGSIFRHHRIHLRRITCCGVAMFDQQPVRALAAFAIVLHSHEHPAAVESATFERELQLALRELPGGIQIAFGCPVAAIPKLHRAAAILTRGNGPFEIAVVERMVFDFDC